MNIDILKKANRINYKSGRVITIDKNRNYKEDDIVMTEYNKRDDTLYVISYDEWKDKAMADSNPWDIKRDNNKINEEYHRKKISEEMKKYTGPNVVEDGQIAVPGKFNEVQNVVVKEKTGSKMR